MAKVQIRDTWLECVDRGSGEPVVFVHGSVSDHRTWSLQQDELRAQFRTIAYSRRFHWPNEKISEGCDYSMLEHLEDLLALLRALDAAPAHLVGHSYGALLCLLVAMRHPDLVRTLVLAEPPAVTLFIGNPPRPWQILSLLLRRPRTAVSLIRLQAAGFGPAAAAIRRGDRETARRLFGTAVLGPEAYQRLTPERVQWVRDNFIDTEFLGSGYPPLDSDRIRGIRNPTLLVAGQKSPRLFHRLLDRLEELLPHSSFVEIPEASHIVHEDNPTAYHDALVTFLLEHRESGRGRVSR